MPGASFAQSNFLGGEWSQTAQGRLDSPRYKTGMNVCLNGLPMEEGNWIRRSGTHFLATTRGGAKGRVKVFYFSGTAPFTMEFTDGFLRFFSNTGTIYTNDPQRIASISSADPALVSTDTPHGWSTGNTVEFAANDPTRGANMGAMRRRQFLITVTGIYTFTIADAVTGTPFNGAAANFDPTDATAQVARVLEVTTPYTGGAWALCNTVQCELILPNTQVPVAVVTILHPLIPPQLLTPTSVTPAGGFIGTFAAFTLAAQTFNDGPYLDPPTNGVTITPSGTSGSITLTASAPTFASTDVGRQMRLFSAPPAWDPSHAYSVGDPVQFTLAERGDGGFYSALQANTGVVPNSNPTIWAANPTVACWVWGTITAFTDNENVTFAIDDDPSILGTDLLYTAPIPIWRFGLYSNTTSYPTCGTYHEGRLWLGGAAGNRFDASMSDLILNWSPTGEDGTVADNNGISYSFNSSDINTVLWMIPDHLGIVCGTQAGEWLIAASQLSDPLTPTSIQAHRVMKNGCAPVEPVRTPLTILAVHQLQQKVLELASDVFSGRFAARNMSTWAKHLTQSGIQELAYQQELTPVLWARMGNGTLCGMTYKRESAFTSEEPTFFGWHRHALGSGRLVESISSGPSTDGELDSVFMVTNDPLTNVRHVEVLTDLFQEGDTIYDAFFLDDATAPASGIFTTSGSAATGVQLFGYNYLIGKQPTVFMAGLDLGQFAVSATDGSITVPFGNGFTQALLSSFGATAFDSILQTTVAQTSSTIPGTTSPQYIQALGPPFGSNDQVAVDWDHDAVIEYHGTVPTSLYRYQISTGALITSVPINSIIPGFDSGGGLTAPITLDDQGEYLYFEKTLTFGACIVYKVDAHTFALIGSFGPDGATNPSGEPSGVPRSDSVCLVSAGGHNFLVSGNAANGPEFGGGLNVVDADTLQFAGHYFVPAESFIYAGRGVTGSSIATVYGIGGENRDTVELLTTTHLYKTTIASSAADYDVTLWPGTPNAGITTTVVGAIAATAIDATWTHLHMDHVPPLYDATDGNVICWFYTNDAVTHTAYVVKLNAATAAVIWAIPVSSANNMERATASSRVRYNRYAFLTSASGTSTIHLINTTTGVDTQSTVHGISLTSQNGQAYDDTVGTIICNVTYTNGNPGIATPLPLNSTPNTFGGWGALYAGPPGPLTGLQGQITSAITYSWSTGIGFTYTSQGQILRPQAQQETGAANGPALGKTRREHMFGAYLVGSQKISFGTSFTTMHAAALASPGGTIPLQSTKLFSGIYWDTIDNTYSFDGMVAWQITRPYPAQVGTISGFIQTSDR